MIKRNIIVIAPTEEAMQGIIRGIESLDLEHEVGIIHGTYGVDAVDEVTLILAELANATIVKVGSILMTQHPKGIGIQFMDLEFPEDIKDDRDAYIDYITNHTKNLIHDILL